MENMVVKMHAIVSIKVVGVLLDCGVYALFPATSNTFGIPSKE